MLKLPENNFVFLETNRFDKDNRCSYFFSNPARTISCHRLENVKRALFELQHFISKGYYAAGFICYEAGFAFEEGLGNLKIDYDFPLLWFGVYRKPVISSHKGKPAKTRQLDYRINKLHLNISREKYINDIKKIKDFIRKGETYQVNYTFKYKFGFSGSILGFYQDLKAKQGVSYSALIKTRDYYILSLSPELFFRKRGNAVEVRPMKGTLSRGVNLEEDLRNMKALERSPKDRSENIMIVDLLRNDLGRVSRPGTVRTEKLFEVEKYETLLQMISIVSGRLKKDLTIYELFKAIFPSGSVTGAPKINTMKIIDSLEKEPRRIYTGSIGFFSPSGEAVFNVAIRTLLIDNKTKRGEIGIGSGVVIDSDAEKEFEECRLKADFITEKHDDFRLIETILWRRDAGYFLLKLHLDRLFASAEYFNFGFDRNSIIKGLKNLEGKFADGRNYRARLLLCKDGRLDLSFSKLNKRAGAAKVRFSDKKVSSDTLFLYHKTTKRALYDKEHARWRGKGYFDIIFTNEKNQITEGAISNIIIKKNNIYYTPPVECGLLDGVFRRYLLKSGKLPIREKILRKKDIKAADEVYMVNSVRGMVRVTL